MFKSKPKNNINFANIYEKAEDALDKIPAIHKRRRRKNLVKALKWIFWVLIVLFLVILSSLIYKIDDIIDLYQNANFGKTSIEKAVVSFQNKRFEDALDYSGQAEDHFKIAVDITEDLKTNWFLSLIPGWKSQAEDLHYLFSSTEVLSRGVNQSAKVGERIYYYFEGKAEVSYSKLSKTEKEEFIKLLYESAPDLNGVKASLELAAENIDRVEVVGFLCMFDDQIYDLRNKLNVGVKIVGDVIPLTEMLPVLAGYPEGVNYLIMFQNNDELRPTGGFMGSYGIMEIASGEIKRVDTHDIYHIDIPVQDLIKIEPPMPLRQYLVRHWYLRDANWSPDWPTSARQIEKFFYAEDKLLPPKNQVNNLKGEFDGIIGLTPALVEDLIGLTGPISLDDKTYTQENFHELLQREVEVDYLVEGVREWDRKEEIGRLFQILETRLFELPSEKWQELYEVFVKNVKQRNILVYFTNENYREISADLNWDGRLRETDSDYLMVVDANLGSWKTDAVINKKIEYEVEQRGDDLIAGVNIIYTHNGGYDWRTTDYKTYTRILVPEGSELINSGGITRGAVEVEELADFNKVSCGGFKVVNPGKIGNLYFEYKLPDRIKEQVKSGYYNLYIQKQPGSVIEELDVDLRFDDKVRSYSPTGFYLENGLSHIGWSGSFEFDKEYNVEIK